MTFAGLILAVIATAGIAVLLTFFLNKKTLPNISSDKDVLMLLHQGDRLNAIKAYRQLHGVSLKEAKSFIEENSTNQDK